MPKLALSRFRSILDFSQKGRTHPHSLRLFDLQTEGLGLLHQRHQPLADIGLGLPRKAVATLASVKKLVAFLTAEIKTVEAVLLQRVPDDLKPTI
jgi:hypothetical protein